MNELSEDLKIEREWMLRQEIQHIQQMMTYVLLYSLPIMVALETALYFVRTALESHLAALHEIGAGDLLPLHRYLIGTAMQLLLACVFSRLSHLMSLRLAGYRTQLRDGKLASGIIELPRFRDTRFLFCFVYFVFPIFDLCIRIVVTIK